MKTICLNYRDITKKIGKEEPVFVIAEMSGNHNQKIENAYKIIDAAAKAGADAIKLQTYTADTITINCDKKYFQVKVNDAWKGQTLYSLYQKASTPWEWQPKLFDYSLGKGLIPFSTPFDTTAVDFLENLEVPLYKVASFELIDIPLIKKIAKLKKPVIISRGMASQEEIEEALGVLKENGVKDIVMLHCVSSYPAKPEEMNLSTISDIVKKFKVLGGLSDHTQKIVAPIAAVALGATVIEKHITLKRSDGGPDAAFSLEPEEFKAMVDSIRIAEKVVGVPSYGAGKKERDNIIFRKSLFVVRDIKKGEKFTERNIRSIRPGYGLKPKYYEEILGKFSNRDIERGTPLSWDFVTKD